MHHLRYHFSPAVLYKCILLGSPSLSKGILSAEKGIVVYSMDGIQSCYGHLHSAGTCDVWLAEALMLTDALDVSKDPRAPHSALVQLPPAVEAP